MQIIPQIVAADRVARKTRAPVYTHAVEYRPWQLQPFMIAPVLPGETMKNLTVQARVITDPLALGFGNIMPWWCEHWYFYVKIRDLPGVKEEFDAMMLTGEAMSLTDAAANAKTYHVGGGIDWLARCLKFITEEGGFRNDGEAWDVSTIDGLPTVAAVKHGANWTDSLTPGAAGTVDPSENLVNPHQTGVVLEEYQAQYEQMRAMRLIDVTFEDFLKMYGVEIPRQVLAGKPELLRYTSNWAYPANTVDPATGSATGAGSWSISERADKDRMFSEFGFIIGVTSVRPKVYMGNQKSSAAIMFDDPFVFLPPLLRDQPHITIRDFVGGSTSPTGPLRNQTSGYWVDVRDALKYGDQFVSAASIGGFAPALPAANGEKRWPTAAMADALFAASAKNKVRQDGTTRLSILGHPTTVVDNT